MGSISSFFPHLEIFAGYTIVLFVFIVFLANVTKDNK